jgi:hypothetical protein
MPQVVYIHRIGPMIVFWFFFWPFILGYRAIRIAVFHHRRVKALQALAIEAEYQEYMNTNRPYQNALDSNDPRARGNNSNFKPSNNIFERYRKHVMIVLAGSLLVSGLVGLITSFVH